MSDDLARLFRDAYEAPTLDNITKAMRAAARHGYSKSGKIEFICNGGTGKIHVSTGVQEDCRYTKERNEIAQCGYSINLKKLQRKDMTIEEAMSSTTTRASAWPTQPTLNFSLCTYCRHWLDGWLHAMGVKT